jgi:ParB family chromosome partitioning protein
MEHNYQTKDVEILKIKFDSSNPRSESEEKILGDPQFKNLRESIKTHGIITPLIIKRDDSGYILIDGERRLRAAILEQLNKTRALIVDSDINGRILAYQIHMLRKQWEKINEIKSLKVIIEDIKKEKPDINDSDLKKQIQNITNASMNHINDWLILLKYNDGIIEKVINEKFPMSHLIRIEKDMINKIKSKYSNILKKISEQKLRETLAQKAEKKLLGPTRYLMDNFKEVFDQKEKKDKIETLLLQFLTQKNIDIQEIHQKIMDLFKVKESVIPDQKILGQEKIITAHPSIIMDKSKSSIDNTASPQPKIPDGLEQSITKPQTEHKPLKIPPKIIKSTKDIKQRFEKVGKSFTHEEFAYVCEALECMEHNCNKAAVLMIWATAVSRIISFVEKNLTDFNISCNAMKSKRYFKDLAKHFQFNVPSIDDLKLNSNDRQLLCYLLEKKIISEPNFKKLKGIYETRCSCAHPTDLVLSTNEIIPIFDNILTIIMTNHHLK